MRRRGWTVGNGANAGLAGSVSRIENDAEIDYA